MPLEPSRGQIRDLLERARFLKQMGRAWDDGQFLLDAQLRQRRAVEGQHLLIALADDEQRGLRRLLPLPWANTTSPRAPRGTASVPSRTPAPIGNFTSRCTGGPLGGLPITSPLWNISRAGGMEGAASNHSAEMIRLGLAGDAMLGRLVDRHVLANPATRP